MTATTRDGSPVRPRTLQKSFAGASEIAKQYPQYSTEIIAAAKQSFLDGADWAYAAGAIAVVLGAALVLLRLPTPRQRA